MGSDCPAPGAPHSCLPALPSPPTRALALAPLPLPALLSPNCYPCHATSKHLPCTLGLQAGSWGTGWASKLRAGCSEQGSSSGA